MEQRFFRCAADAYESMREQFDAAQGYPNDAAETTFFPVAQAVRDQQGMCYLALPASLCDGSPGDEILPPLLDSGAVASLTEAEYLAVLPLLPPPMPMP